MGVTVIQVSWALACIALFVLTPYRTTALSIVRHRGWNHPIHLKHEKKSLSILNLAADGGTKKKRRRKQPSGSTENVRSIAPTEDGDTAEEDDEDKPELGQEKEQLLAELKAVASFRPTTREERMMGAAAPSPQLNMITAPVTPVESQLVDLPDIKNVLQKKEMKKIEEEEDKKIARPKISRKDKEAFIRLLEEQPFADADDSYFEEEEYDVINALLAERAEPFLGIPLGPLQVGHFMGALVIMLMAFVQYPGFPLTNLPTPTRDSLQLGLLVTYSINTVLAILASFKAGERGQPKLLWVLKTLSVGGLAYDQLTQLPTVEEIKKQDERKRVAQSKSRKR